MEFKRLIFLLSFFVALQHAYAVKPFAVTYERCTEDNLDPAQAKIRNQWGKRCLPQHAADIDYFSSRKPMLYMLVHSNSKNTSKGPQKLDAPCEDWALEGFCLASCYTDDQMVSFAKDGYMTLPEAMQKSPRFLTSLRDDANVENPRFTKREVAEYTISRRDAEEHICHITTKLGGSLSVTDGHPVLLAGGQMVKAQDLFIGQSLLRADGKADEIIEIMNKTIFGKVYNVAPNSGTALGNIIVAQGFLLGSARYQYMEELNNLFNRKILRSIVEL